VPLAPSGTFSPGSISGRDLVHGDSSAFTICVSSFGLRGTRGGGRGQFSRRRGVLTRTVLWSVPDRPAVWGIRSQRSSLPRASGLEVDGRPDRSLCRNRIAVITSSPFFGINLVMSSLLPSWRSQPICSTSHVDRGASGPRNSAEAAPAIILAFQPHIANGGKTQN